MANPSDIREEFEAAFRDAVRKEFKIKELLEVARGGLHCEMIKTHVSKHDMVESQPFPDWSCRLAWWKAIAQAGGMIAEQVDGGTSQDALIRLLAEARSRVPE
jgi:hypothetical protein